MNNTRDQKTTAKHIQALTDKSASHVVRAGAIGVIAYDKLYEYEPQLRELVDDSDDFIQAIALFHLVGTWGRIDLLDTLLHIALHHPSSFSRDEMYAALGNLIAYHKITDSEIKDRALTTLIAALLNETDSTQQRSAYEAILHILDGSIPIFSKKTFDRDADISWVRLEPYMDAAKRLPFTQSEF